VKEKPMIRMLTLLALAGLAVVLAACGGGAADADRTVSVRMFDDMRYEPERFDVDAGQTVRFEVTNSGEVRHEFFIGTTDAHREHADEMRAREHADEAHANPAAVSVEPGERGTLEYTFDEAGELLVGCHEPGHYEAGMVAPITVHP
jgi:uncharacterized cupredoxin-like copper-binding protein